MSRRQTGELLSDYFCSVFVGLFLFKFLDDTISLHLAVTRNVFRLRLDATVAVLTAVLFEFPPVPQPPTITMQSPKNYIFDPRENIVIHCEAKGKPHPR